jgi:hypothetical protein
LYAFEVQIFIKFVNITTKYFVEKNYNL